MGMAEHKPMEALVKIRKQAGYNQDFVAEQIGVHKNTYSRWERGETSPTVQDLIALADFFGCSIDAIIGYEGGFSVSELDDLLFASQTINGILLKRLKKVEQGKPTQEEPKKS